MAKPAFPKATVQFAQRTPEAGACDRCGALVVTQDQQRHRTWHNDNDK